LEGGRGEEKTEGLASKKLGGGAGQHCGGLQTGGGRVIQPSILKGDPILGAKGHINPNGLWVQ